MVCHMHAVGNDPQWVQSCPPHHQFSATMRAILPSLLRFGCNHCCCVRRFEPAG